MLLRYFTAFILILAIPAMATDIYKTRDKDGNVVYTDKPPAGESEQVNLPPINSLSSGNLPSIPKRAKPQQPQPERYDINVLSPRENVTITPGQRDLAIAVGLSQSLSENHWILYFINDELIEETQSTSIVIQDIPRGTHRITIDVIDKDGNILGQSDVVEVNVIRPTVKRNPTPQPSPR
jgi:hypothetical protein